MDFKQMYQEKLVSAEKAASVIKSGDWVDYGWTTATPVAVEKTSGINRRKLPRRYLNVGAGDLQD